MGSIIKTMPANNNNTATDEQIILLRESTEIML